MSDNDTIEELSAFRICNVKSADEQVKTNFSVNAFQLHMYIKSISVGTSISLFLK